MKKFTLEIAKTMKPAGFWEAFNDLCSIPRPSGQEEQIAKFLEQKFKDKGCVEVTRDKNNNVHAIWPASAGCEDWPMITIQGHMDMVPAKTSDSTHDFTKDPIEAYIDGDKLTANKTTLGADDGISIATMYAIMEDKELKHGPVEFLCTTEEETGNTGAIEIDPTPIKGQYLLNIDWEYVNEVLIGCVSCVSQDSTLNFKRVPLNSNQKIISLELKDLKSGHSGNDIHQKRINSIKMAFDLLYNARFGEHKHEVQLVSINGGFVKNAIPSDFTLKFAANKDEIECIKKDMQAMLEDYRVEFKGYDDSFTYEFKDMDCNCSPIEISDSDRIINCYNGVFNGLNVYDYDHSQPETSTNCGVIKTNENDILSQWYARSLYRNAAFRIANMVDSVFRLANGKAEIVGFLPPWSPIYNSDLEKCYSKAFKKVMGKDPYVHTCPGGLECATLLNRCKSLKEAISVGADTVGVHTPDEYVSISSCEKLYNIVREFLASAHELKK